jgi:hypothetical protein
MLLIRIGESISLSRTSQFSRYPLGDVGTVGSLDGEKNARPGVIKLIKNNTFLAFLAPFKRRGLRRPDRSPQTETPLRTFIELYKSGLKCMYHSKLIGLLEIVGPLYPYRQFP